MFVRLESFGPAVLVKVSWQKKVLGKEILDGSVTVQTDRVYVHERIPHQGRNNQTYHRIKRSKRTLVSFISPSFTQ